MPLGEHVFYLHECVSTAPSAALRSRMWRYTNRSGVDHENDAHQEVGCRSVREKMQQPASVEGLDPAADAELDVGALDVAAAGMDADPHHSRDRLRLQSLADVAKNLQLTHREVLVEPLLGSIRGDAGSKQ